MAIQGTLYVRQLDESGNSIKWEISGDAQSRIDVVFSEWIVVEEMTQAPPFRRVMEIVDTNGMCAFGPALTENPLLLGGSTFNFQVSNVDEAIAIKNNQINREALSYWRR